MKGILVRVGIDTTTGRWNGPVDPETGEYVYVPIPEDPRLVRPGFFRPFGELIPALDALHTALPEHLRGRPMHLDPDFFFLTYGDRHPRDIPLRSLEPGDFLVFYTSLRSIRPGDRPEDRPLIYAITGFFEVADVVTVSSVPMERWNENAHTRRFSDPGDTIVRGRPGVSGRLSRCIPIGEYRDHAYRVRTSLLKAWGGLSVRDGFLQRSGRLPSFRDPARFLQWFRSQHIPLVQQNF